MAHHADDSTQVVTEAEADLRTKVALLDQRLADVQGTMKATLGGVWMLALIGFGALVVAGAYMERVDGHDRRLTLLESPAAAQHKPPQEK
jgi:hypothetical protein